MSSSRIDELLVYIFAQGKSSPLAGDLAGWLRDSRRLRAFAETYRDKIRRKYRLARDQGSLKDLRCELETAALLLREPQFALEYERYTSSKQRGPDFTVTFKTHTPFNVEVRRMRESEADGSGANPRASKLIAIICDKIGQMRPGMVNLLWIYAESPVQEADLKDTLTTLRRLAEGKDEAFFGARGFDSAADFLRQYRHLSGIVVWQTGERLIWLNPLAKYRLPPNIVLTLQRLSS